MSIEVDRCTICRRVTFAGRLHACPPKYLVRPIPATPEWWVMYAYSHREAAELFAEWIDAEAGAFDTTPRFAVTVMKESSGIERVFRCTRALVPEYFAEQVE